MENIFCDKSIRSQEQTKDQRNNNSRESIGINETKICAVIEKHANCRTSISFHTTAATTTTTLQIECGESVKENVAGVDNTTRRDRTQIKAS